MTQLKRVTADAPGAHPTGVAESPGAPVLRRRPLHLAGHHPNVVRDRRAGAPWYATKTCPSYLDMIVKLRRVLIAAQYQPEAPRQPTHEESAPCSWPGRRQPRNRETRMALRCSGPVSVTCWGSRRSG